ncbi:hypothetical protein SAMN06264364_13246 [Quadrisphaera granulorum]|uniref:Uncharacterized protein n=1 Tax=Quadrisphaera granulorum TaxID=317664 RepID=A0A315ZRK4_9ACTN|nr:hypothetical protein [Quadrisphaera granulorum]PWJ48166.1 hypothetical protein BXY45_13246 [Quadrisphaera granulorum]SZE98535.1 hypothetical protein SAMN06264364_13246 [Quadrisphaera granulorum]
MTQQIVVKNRQHIQAEAEDALGYAALHGDPDPQGTGVSHFCKRTGYSLHSVGFDSAGHPQTWVFARTL